MNVTSKRMREIDRQAIEKFGIPSLILMENAGRSVAEAALKMLGSKRHVLVICGKGNNGGDGFVAGRHLMNHGVKVRFYVLASPRELSKDALLNYQILKKMKADIHSWNRKVSMAQADLIIDAILGTGLSKDLSEPYFSVVQRINKSRKPVLAIDIPTGLNGDTGRVMSIAVKANRTMTLGLAKKGLFRGDGPKYTGKVEVGDISLPAVLGT